MAASPSLSEAGKRECMSCTKEEFNGLGGLWFVLLLAWSGVREEKWKRKPFVYSETML